ncbi:MAG: hypothetical protein IJA79_05740 [Desulfovibrio sp.]|nr:hypothetical protein [Desulfovibrio sp.]
MLGLINSRMSLQKRRQGWLTDQELGVEMETSALASGLKVHGSAAENTASLATKRTIAATDVLSDFEKTFFAPTLQASGHGSPELFSNQGISTLSFQEMNYWSIELHNSMLQ